MEKTKFRGSVWLILRFECKHITKEYLVDIVLFLLF